MLWAWWESSSRVSGTNRGTGAVAGVGERDCTGWFDALVDAFLRNKRLSADSCSHRHAGVVHSTGGRNRRLVPLVLGSGSKMAFKRVHVRRHQADLAEHKAQPTCNGQADEMKSTRHGKGIEEHRLESIHEGLVREAGDPYITLGTY